MPQTTRTVRVQSQKRGGMEGSPSRRFAFDSSTASKPRVWVGSSFIAERPSTAKIVDAAFGRLSPARALGSMLGLGDLPDHEADVRVAGESRRLEHALHDERSDHLVD